MKKFFTIVLASVLLFAVTAPAMAMHTETFGSVRVRHFASSNFFESGENDEFIDQRFRLSFNWGLSETSGLKMRADFNEGKWGGTDVSFQDTAGVDPITGLPVTTRALAASGTKREIHVDQMYGWFKFPNAPVTLTIGRQPVGWGHGILASGDNRDRVKLAIDITEELYVDFTYDQFVERHVAHRENSTVNDLRSGGPVFVYQLGGGWEVGGVYVYVEDKDLGAARTEHIIGGMFSGTAGPVTLKGDVNFLSGEIENGTTFDESGLIAYGSAGVDAGPANVTLEVGYAAGDESSADENEGALSHDLDGPMQSVILFNDLYGGRMGWGSNGDNGLSNAIMVKGTAKFKPSPRVGLKVAAMFATADEPNAAGDDEMGFEIDGGLSVAIVDHITYSLDIGWLSAGDFWGTDVDDPVLVVNKIQFDF